MAALGLAPLWGGGFGVAFAQLALFYYGLGSLLHWGLPAALPGALHGIQEAPRGQGEVARDAVHSIGPIAVKAAIWVVVEQLHARGWGQLYAGPVAGPWQVAYLLLCIVLLDYLHDTWFYWTHRLLHWRPLYRWVHWEHHRSTAPSAFTGYSFHVAEAAIVFANEVLVCFLFPLHMGLHRLYHIATTVIHEAGHAGYELAPFIPTIEGLGSLLACGLRGSPLLNTVQHHDLHHRFPSRHFSLYFTHWDRLCGTLHPKYDARLFRYFEGDAPAGGTASGPAAGGNGSGAAAAGDTECGAAAAGDGGGGEQQRAVATGRSSEQAAGGRAGSRSRADSRGSGGS